MKLIHVVEVSLYYYDYRHENSFEQLPHIQTYEHIPINGNTTQSYIWELSEVLYFCFHSLSLTPLKETGNVYIFVHTNTFIKRLRKLSTQLQPLHIHLGLCVYICM